MDTEQEVRISQSREIEGILKRKIQIKVKTHFGT